MAWMAMDDYGEVASAPIRRPKCREPKSGGRSCGHTTANPSNAQETLLETAFSVPLRTSSLFCRFYVDAFFSSACAGAEPAGFDAVASACDRGPGAVCHRWKLCRGGSRLSRYARA